MLMRTTESRSVFKPIEFPWALSACEIQNKMHWLPYEIDLLKDLQEFKNTLTNKERDLITQILRFFTQADLEVGRCYIDYYLRVFRCPEIRMMLITFASMEVIHVLGYSYLITALKLPDSEYEAFLKYKEMSDKYDYMQNFNINDPQEMALTLAIVSGFIEGFVLFASFSILISFSMKRPVSCLHGTGQIVALSIRDETLHCLSIIKLFKTYVEENADKIDIRKLHADIYTNCQKLMEMETAFIDLAFKDGDLDFLSSEELKQYIKYLANLRLSQLGLEPIYNQKTNPLPWMEDYLRPREVVNFFETISTSYTKADLSGEVSEDSFF